MSIAEELKKMDVWNKGHKIPDRDPNMWRRDDLGYEINYYEYGNRSSVYGWEFDHYPIPASQGGSDEVYNLRPLYWAANASLGNRGGLLG